MMIELSLKDLSYKKEKGCLINNPQKYCELEIDKEINGKIEINNSENYNIYNKKFINYEKFLIINYEYQQNSKDTAKDSIIEVSELISPDININHSTEIIPRKSVEEIVGNISITAAIYVIVSISIVFLNYKIFSGIIKFPIFVSWFQQLVGLLIFHILRRSKNNLSIELIEFTNFENFQWKTGKCTIQLTLTFIGMISLSNLCLKHVLVSTYQIARSTTIIFNLILSYIILNQRFSIITIISCIIVMIGFIIGAFDSNALNFNGIFYGIFSSILQSLYCVLVKRQLNIVNDNHIQLLYYQIYLSSIMFIPVLIITGEMEFFYLLFNFDQGLINICLLFNCLLISGILSVLINFSTFKLIKKTNTITFNIIALLKSCVQSIGGILLFNEVVNFQTIFGIFLTLFGSFIYSINSNPKNSTKSIENIRI